MKTTVQIPDALYGQASKLAKARGEQVSTLITEGLQKLVAAQLPPVPARAGKNGKGHPTTLSTNAARWLAEWRALGQRRAAPRSTGRSAAEVVSRMRR